MAETIGHAFGEFCQGILEQAYSDSKLLLI
jgi:hypothetical protein